MVKTKHRMKTEEAVARYTEGAVLSAVRLERYWMNRGYSKEEAVNKAVNQALGMMISGDLRRAPELLENIEEVCRVLKKRSMIDCACCSFMPSLDLYRQDEVRKDAGGELYILHLTLGDPVCMAIYHNVGGLLGSLEDVLIGVFGSDLSKVIFVHQFMWQSLRDLRASSILAFCGRYRQAFSTLRSALEILIVGTYFQTLETRKENARLDTEWEEFWRGKGIWGKAIKELRRRYSNKEFSKSGSLWGKLSKTVHTLAKGDVESDEELARPASAFYNGEYLKEWFKFLMRISTLIQEAFLFFPFDVSERSKKGLDLFSSIAKELKKDKERAVGFVNCPKLKYFNQ